MRCARDANAALHTYSQRGLLIFPRCVIKSPFAVRAIFLSVLLRESNYCWGERAILWLSLTVVSDSRARLILDAILKFSEPRDFHRIIKHSTELMYDIYIIRPRMIDCARVVESRISAPRELTITRRLTRKRERELVRFIYRTLMPGIYNVFSSALFVIFKLVTRYIFLLKKKHN